VKRFSFLEHAVIGSAASPRRPLMRRAGQFGLAALFVAAPVTMLFQLAAQPSDISPRPVVVEGPIKPLPHPVQADPLVVALGELLFNDPRLSRDNSRSCVSCHDLATNGAGAASRDIGLEGRPLPLNTLTVFNAALSFRLNWEGKFRSLEEQAAASLTNPQVMGTTLAEVVGKLEADPAMVNRFLVAYGRPPDADSVLDALATFERTLLTPGSRFDRWLAGAADALNDEEQNGYRLFKSLGCISCHQGVNIGGNLFQRHGIFHPLASPTPEVLRVPSLRNVATTPPYFHDGSAPDLEDAVRKMGISQLNSTLTDEQTGAIVAFLRSLTGEYQGLPLRGPR
jgi:cytochrome c peroxidase